VYPGLLFLGCSVGELEDATAALTLGILSLFFSVNFEIIVIQKSIAKKAIPIPYAAITTGNGFSPGELGSFALPSPLPPSNFFDWSIFDNGSTPFSLPSSSET
jgi:hypothetical protein